MRLFTPKQISKLLNISQRTIQYYGDIEIIKPYEASGPGRPRKYTFQNILDIYVIRVLGKAGFRLELIKNILNKR